MTSISVAPRGSRIHYENARQGATVALGAYQIDEGSAKQPWWCRGDDSSNSYSPRRFRSWTENTRKRFAGVGFGRALAGQYTAGVCGFLFMAPVTFLSRQLVTILETARGIVSCTRCLKLVKYVFFRGIATLN